MNVLESFLTYLLHKRTEKRDRLLAKRILLKIEGQTPRTVRLRPVVWILRKFRQNKKTISIPRKVDHIQNKKTISKPRKFDHIHICHFLGWSKAQNIIKRAGFNTNHLKYLNDTGDNKIYDALEKIEQIMTDKEKDAFIKFMMP